MARSDATLHGLEEGLQVATLTETREEVEQVPEAPTISTNIPRATVVRSTTSVEEFAVWGEQVRGLPPVQPVPLIFPGHRNKCCPLTSAEADRRYQTAICLVLLIVLGAICSAIYAIVESASLFASNAKRSPTQLPTFTPTRLPTTAGPLIPRANVLVCPPIFVGGLNSTLTACKFSGCGGSIEWCGLNASKRYELVVDVRGDFDLAQETVTVTFNGNSTVGSASTQCSENFERVINQEVDVRGGDFKLTYQTSSSVTPVCGENVFSAELRATLIQVD